MLAKITKRTVDAFTACDRDAFLWDSSLTGFGLKVTPHGRKVYIVQYQSGGRSTPSRRVTIGVHGSPWTPEGARKTAATMLAEVDLGTDPAAERTRLRRDGTISQIAERYLSEHVTAHNKPSTAAEVRRIVATRIKPSLGRHRVSELARAHVKAWHQSMASTPYEANRALAYCSKMMSLAVTEWELRPDNPCIGVKRFPEQRRERFLTDEELRRIGGALAKLELMESFANAVRLLALTGCRLAEVLTLRWQDVDLEHGAIRLPDAKTGARTVPLGAPALALLAGISRAGLFVVPGVAAGSCLNANTFRNLWNRLRIAAGVPDARPHDLRHTTGTYAAQAGFNAFLIRDLLGHKTVAMTGRYVERATDPMRAAADVVAGRVAAALGGNSATAEVVQMPPRKRRRGA